MQEEDIENDEDFMVLHENYRTEMNAVRQEYLRELQRLELEMKAAVRQSQLTADDQIAANKEYLISCLLAERRQIEEDLRLIHMQQRHISLKDPKRQREPFPVLQLKKDVDDLSSIYFSLSKSSEPSVPVSILASEAREDIATIRKLLYDTTKSSPAEVEENDTAIDIITPPRLPALELPSNPILDTPLPDSSHLDGTPYDVTRDLERIASGNKK